ncbi:MAG: response regulator [Oscillospiraceae bacterium]|nr:response regulator [Oscillospiraceae bacterium]
MLNYATDTMIYLGALLMVFNIYGFIRFARFVKGLKMWGGRNAVLYVPIVLLVLFLVGYLAVAFFGSPSLTVAGILFGGSIFVFVMYWLLSGVTQRILSGEQLEAKLMAAEESNRAKTEFLANVSHEMRTPMNVILGLAELELKNPGLEEQTRQRLEKIDESGKHLLGLINNVLDMNRIENGTMTLKSNEFCLGESLGQVSAIIQTLCEEKGLEYTCGRIPPGAQGRYSADELMLKSVLISILDNAVKYTDAGGSVSLQVECTGRQDNVRTLCFTVSDTGVGISEEFLPRIFDTFSKEDAGFTDKYGGGGLSLARAKSAVELMGGTVRAESMKGKGSVFTVTVPMTAVSETCCDAPAAPEEETGLAGCRVLIVEDVPENAEIVQDLLELEGVKTEHAENGRVGLDAFSASPPGYYDAVLMDLRMPVMDGLESARQIRALERPDAKTVPIIALTANAFATDIQNALDSGMNEHLTKPADAELLYATLKKHIGKARVGRGVQVND